MIDFFATGATKSIPITPIVCSEFEAWLKNQDEKTKNWLRFDSFRAEVGTRCLIKNAQGHIERVLFGIDYPKDFWTFAALPRCLPEGVYSIDAKFSIEELEHIAVAWGTGFYQFTPYKKPIPLSAKLSIPKKIDVNILEHYLQAIFLVRDLINTPADDMGPPELAEAATALAEQFNAEVKQIVGEELLTQGFPTIYTVGRGSVHAPRLIDLRWGNPQDPKITLVGKGVCFDSGGLDLKPSDSMLWMKKDMGGAAHVLGIAYLIMSMRIPVRLRVLIPAVENAVSGDAYHPGDIITTRKGITVEVTNTDAEGRLVLCDALTEAATENPEILIDFATLTGAANIALGPEIPAFFTPQDELAHELVDIAFHQGDLVWRLPLYKPYRRYLDSQIADIMNSSLMRYAGSITAALFLKEFVPTNIPWVHFDLMAWNIETRFGRLLGGEARGLRTVFKYLQKRFNK